MKKILGLLLICTLFIVGCGQKEESKVESASKKVVVRVNQDPDFLDPHKYIAAGTGEILYNVFEGLVKPNEKGELYPALAESYEISEDGLTYTFKIKKGILFQNGVELTSDLVKLSYDRFIAKDFPSNRVTSTFKKIIKDIKVEEDKVKFTFSEVDGSGLGLFLIGVVLEEEGNLHGTGPYMLETYSPAEKVTFTKYSNYWDIANTGNVEEVEFKIIKDEQSAISAFQMGEVNIIPRVLVSYIDMLGRDGKVVKNSQNLVQLLALNNKVKPLDDIRVRQAIHYATNKQEIIDGSMEGEGKITGSASSPLVANIYNVDTEKLYEYNLEKAKSLLEEAGYPNGLKLSLKAPANYQIYVDSAQITKEQLRKAGIEVEISEVEWGNWLTEVYKERNYQATIIGFEGEASPYRIFDRYVSNDSRNMVNFDNKEYNEIIARAKVEQNEAKRIELFKEAQYILTSNVASVFVQSPNYLVALSSNIEGFKFYPLYILDIASLVIKN